MLLLCAALAVLAVRAVGSEPPSLQALRPVLALSTVSAGQRTLATEVVQRAGAFVTDFEKRFSTLVAEEHYVQEVKDGNANRPVSSDSLTERPMADRGALSAGDREKQTGKRRREMRSDVLLVQLEDGTWFGFRDVIEVDGKRVRNRENRLMELFVKSRAKSGTVMDESARYNIGPVTRNSNLPTYALLYLDPGVQSRFFFDKAGEETVEGTPAWVISFFEVRTPTIVRDPVRNVDVPSSGRFWINPKNGEVLKSDLTMGGVTTPARGRAIVTYRRDDKLGVLVPATMIERWDTPSQPWKEYVECTATYTNFRRFEVKTEEKIVVPKGGT